MSTIQVLIFATLFIAIVLFILFYDRIRKSKLFRKNEYKAAERAARKAAKEEEYFRRVSTRHYREDEKEPEFDKDYFKGKEDTQEEKTEQQKETARRTTTSSDGVTIIDERQPAEKTATKEKKIFDDSEGEYVEFEEV